MNVCKNPTPDKMISRIPNTVQITMRRISTSFCILLLFFTSCSSDEPTKEDEYYWTKSELSVTDLLINLFKTENDGSLYVLGNMDNKFGVYRFDENNWSAVAYIDTEKMSLGITDFEIYNSTLYVSAHSGLWKYNGDEFEKVVDGSIQAIEEYNGMTLCGLMYVNNIAYGIVSFDEQSISALSTIGCSVTAKSEEGIFIGGGNGKVYELIGTTITEIFSYGRTFATDLDNNLYIAYTDPSPSSTRHAVAVYKNGEITTIEATLPIFPLSITAFEGKVFITGINEVNSEHESYYLSKGNWILIEEDGDFNSTNLFYFNGKVLADNIYSNLGTDLGMLELQKK